MGSLFVNGRTSTAPKKGRGGRDIPNVWIMYVLFEVQRNSIRKSIFNLHFKEFTPHYDEERNDGIFWRIRTQRR